MSEIDDIFGGGAALVPDREDPENVSLSKSQSTKSKKPKAKSDPPAGPSEREAKDQGDKKRKRPKDTDDVPPPETEATESRNSKPKKLKTKRPVHEVEDPSAGVGTTSHSEPDARMVAAASRLVAEHDSGKGSRGLRKGRPYVAPAETDDSDAVFADSRGLRGAGRKTTIEGWSVYTEKELGMDNPYAGETDLCPFDCDCCESNAMFFRSSLT